MDKIKIFIADDHDVVVAGIETILSMQSEYLLVGTANDGRDAWEKIKKLRPNIVILDINMPEITGIEVCKLIQENLPDIKVIFHTCDIDEKSIISSFEAGAYGYIPKNFKAIDLLEAVNAATKERKYLKGIVSEVMVNSYLKSKKAPKKSTENSLSDREIEVIQYLAQGYLNKQIADKMNLSQRTIEGHKSNMLKKLNMNSSIELVIYAIKEGLITI